MQLRDQAYRHLEAVKASHPDGNVTHPDIIDATNVLNTAQENETHHLHTCTQCHAWLLELER